MNSVWKRDIGYEEEDEEARWRSTTRMEDKKEDEVGFVVRLDNLSEETLQQALARCKLAASKRRERELEHRANALALRMTIGLVQRYGEERVRDAALRLGAEALENRVSKSIVIFGTIIAITDSNAPEFASELSRLLTDPFNSLPATPIISTSTLFQDEIPPPPPVSLHLPEPTTSSTTRQFSFYRRLSALESCQAQATQTMLNSLSVLSRPHRPSSSSSSSSSLHRSRYARLRPDRSWEQQLRKNESAKRRSSSVPRNRESAENVRMNASFDVGNMGRKAHKKTEAERRRQLAKAYGNYCSLRNASSNE